MPEMIKFKNALKEQSCFFNHLKSKLVPNFKSKTSAHRAVERLRADQLRKTRLENYQ